MTHDPIEKRVLKTILWIYIALCVLIAGLNYGYAPHANAQIASFLTWFWHFYENWVKTLFILACGILTLRIIGKSRRTALRKRNLIGFVIAALAVHIVLPLLTGNQELYFFTMPLPWTTTPLQLLNEGSSFYQSRFPVWGAVGISTALIFYVVISVIVFASTLLFGRRLQCSSLCLFNGFAAEVFDPAIPLIGKPRKIGSKLLKTLTVIRWIFLTKAVLLALWWIFLALGVRVPGDLLTMGKAEVSVYLAGELLMAMFFWAAFAGRGYCFYCPLGTVLALLSKIAGQRILTANTRCVECNRCNESCPMAIDIKTLAAIGMEVKNLRCVGCGHCVDACPTKTLSYTTAFLTKVSRWRTARNAAEGKDIHTDG
jgi:polyferredoxin